MKPLSKTATALPLSAALRVDLRAKELIASGMDVISFCVGEPDFETPEPIRLAGISAIRDGNTKYTNASGTLSLKKAVAAAFARDDCLQYEPNEIAITPGAKYAVYAALLALVNPGDDIILPAPYWTSYMHSIFLAGASPVVVPCKSENGFKLTPEQLENAVTENAKALILNNPNNPSGAVYTGREMRALMEVCQRNDLYVISDEIYSRLLYTDEPFCSAASIDADMREHTVTINGVSKAYAMTGWRIGYAAGNRDIIRAISAILSHTTGAPNTMAQLAAEKALLGDQSEVLHMRQVFQTRRDVLIDMLSGLPQVTYTVPQGAFYCMLDVSALLKNGAFQSEVDLAVQLLETEGVAAVPCTDYGAPGYLRLSFTLDEARIRQGVQRIKRFIERQL